MIGSSCRGACGRKFNNLMTKTVAVHIRMNCALSWPRSRAYLSSIHNWLNVWLAEYIQKWIGLVGVAGRRLGDGLID